MRELIEDIFGEVDVETLSITSNIAYHVGYRRVVLDHTEIKPPYEPWADWVWSARYWAEEE
jgi:hypothetical protein